MGLVGRDRELAVVAQAILDARAGASRVLGVMGEAGIGKSALLDEIAGRAGRAGMLVLRGRGAEHERAVPFGVVVDAFDDCVATGLPDDLATVAGVLAAILPSAAPATAPAGPVERFRYNRALRALLESLGKACPVALVLDDLHWADDASIELVLHLLRRPPAGAHLLAFAARDVDPAPRLLDAARAATPFTPLALEPLDDASSRRLIASIDDPARRERVAREARGNPFFLSELARASGRPGDTLPRSLLAAVTLELRALEPAARTLIDGAAVAGDPFDPELAAAAAGTEHNASALDDLVAADLVRPAGEGCAFAFRHPLVHRAVYDAVAPAWRLAAHERVAASLERRGACPALRAHHVERYARPGDLGAIAVLREAGAAAGPAAPATAAHWLTAGLRLVADGDVRRRAELLRPIAAALGAAGRLTESRDALVELLALLGPASTADHVSVVAACAGVEGIIGRHADARARLLSALQDAAPEERGALLLGLATAASYTGDVDGLRTWAARAAEAAGEDPPLLAEAEACGALGALWAGEGERAAALLDRAAQRLSGIDDRRLAARLDCARQVACAQLLAERYAEAADTAMRGLAIARRTQQGQPLPALLIYRAGALGNLLELDAARCAIDAAEESARLQRLPHVLAFALWQSALVHHFQGAASHARADVAEFSGIVASLEPGKLTATGACVAASLGADEDPERCRSAITRLGGPQLEAVLPTWMAALLLCLVRCELALGRHEPAQAWATLAHTRAAALRLPASHVRAAIAQAEVLLAHDQPEPAARLALEAAAAGEHASALRDAAEARLLAGHALATAGESERATAELQRVADDAAGRLGQAATRRLRRLGVRPATARRRATRRNGPASLTEREREVAALVAQGHANKQIAATLYLSEKTIANTLTRVYAKLGVRSRTQLARTPD